MKKLKKEKFVLPVVENDENVPNVTVSENVEDIKASAVLDEQNITENPVEVVTEPVPQEEPLTFFGKPIDEAEKEINESAVTTDLSEQQSIPNEAEESEKPSFYDVLEISANEGLLASATDDFSQDLPLPQPKIKNILDVDDEEDEVQEKVDTPKEMVDGYDVSADVSTLLSDEEYAEIEEELKNKYHDDNTEIVEEPQLFSEVSDDEVRQYEQGIIEVPDEDI